MVWVLEITVSNMGRKALIVSWYWEWWSQTTLQKDTITKINLVKLIDNDDDDDDDESNDDDNDSDNDNEDDSGGNDDDIIEIVVVLMVQ